MAGDLPLPRPIAMTAPILATARPPRRRTLATPVVALVALLFAAAPTHAASVRNDHQWNIIDATGTTTLTITDNSLAQTITGDPTVAITAAAPCTGGGTPGASVTCPSGYASVQTGTDGPKAITATSVTPETEIAVMSAPAGQAPTAHPLTVDLSGHAGNGLVFGGDGPDTLIAPAGRTTFAGGASDDTLRLTTGLEHGTFHGQGGTDTITAQNAGRGVTLCGQSGFCTDPDASPLGSGVERLIGSGHDDTLHGSTGADEMHAGAGNDTVTPGDGKDVVDGGTGHDLASYAGTATPVAINLAASTAQAMGETDAINGFEDAIGGDADDTITAADYLPDVLAWSSLQGGQGNDTITGGDAALAASGGPGNDTIRGGAGQMQVDAGTGTDHVDLAGQAAGRVIRAHRAIGLDNDPGGVPPLSIDDHVYAAERITGSSGDDVIIATDGADRIEGAAGDDRLIGRGGDDTLSGGTGHDTLDGGTGTDQMHGDTGTDTIDYSTRSNPVRANLSADICVTAGCDVSEGEVGERDNAIDAESVTGGQGDDTLTGGQGAGTINGGPGNDLVAAGAQQTAVLIGGPGNDTITGGADDTASYETHTQPVAASLDGQTNDGAQGESDTIASTIGNLRGGRGADTLTGSPAANTVDGREGDDTLRAVAGGHDTLVGGPGADTVDYSTADDAIDAELGQATPGSGRDGITSVERLTGSPFADTLRAAPSGGELHAGGGDDRLYPAAAGQSSLDGGPGGDELRLDAQPNPATVDLHTQTGSLDLPTGADALMTLTAIEHVHGSPAADTLTGDGQPNRLRGADGDDVLDGAAGPDILEGATGSDTVTYETRSTAVTVTLDTADGGDGQAGENDTVRDDVENVTGGQGNDTLTASQHPNQLHGGPGDDTLASGQAEQDATAAGGTPRPDVYDGGSGQDTIDYQARTGAIAVTLDGQANDGAPGEADDVTGEKILGGSGNDTLTGDGQPNLLDGGSGNDTISGQGGDDTLRGGLGADVLLGGAGQDSADAGDGDDDLQLRDGQADSARCGSGNDTVTADSADDTEPAACEQVSLTAPPAGGGAGNGGATPGPQTTIVNNTTASSGAAQAGPPNNGQGADRLASLRALKDGVDYGLLRARRGEPITVTGRLLTAAGQPIGGAQLGVYLRPTGQAEAQQAGTLRTDPQGGWTYHGVARLGGMLRIGYKANLSDVDFTRTKDIELVVTPDIRLKVNRTRVRNGQGVRFTGRVVGMPAWSKKIALLQVRVGGRWRTFGRDKHIDRTGVMRASYRFTSTLCLPGRRCVVPYKFRFWVPAETGWPFAGAASKAVTVHVRGART
jgi:Ca2+-binding RTX toxin-like protein